MVDFVSEKLGVHLQGSHSRQAIIETLTTCWLIFQTQHPHPQEW